MEDDNEANNNNKTNRIDDVAHHNDADTDVGANAGKQRPHTSGASPKRLNAGPGQQSRRLSFPG
jgi:hypothetical protein